MNRRNFISKSALFLTGNLILSPSVFGEAKKPLDSKKAIIVYFSYTGNTRTIAKKISKSTGIDLLEIKPKQAYPDSHNDCVNKAKEELKAQARPEIILDNTDFSKYDVIILGYPNWWRTFPMPVATFLDKIETKGKTILPFCTHEGSGIGDSKNDLKKLCPESTIGREWICRGGKVNDSDESLAQWIKSISL